VRVASIVAIGSFGVAAAIMVASAACSAPPLPDADNDMGPITPIPKRDASTSDRGSNLNSTEASTGDGATECHKTGPNFRCSLLEQCGCAPNETCDITDFKTLVNSCVTAGNLALGRQCAATSACQPGLACIFGACRPYCDVADTKCTGPGLGVCVAAYDADGKAIPNSNSCTINCDPMRPEAVCGTGAACLWFPTMYKEKVSDCDQPGTGAELATCTLPAGTITDGSQCKAGLTCAHHARLNLNECERWCRLPTGTQTFATDCQSGFSCKDVFGANAPTVNGIREGVCQD
jgi:hypothetical protein